MTSQELRNWNRRVERAAKQNIYIGDKITMKQYRDFNSRQKQQFTKKYNIVKGKKTTTLPLVSRGNVQVWKREDISIQRKLTALKPKQQAFKQELRKLPVIYGGKKTRLKVGSTGGFKSLFMTPKTKYVDVNFRNIAGFKSYVSTFGSSVNETLTDYQNQFISSIEYNVINYVIDDGQIKRLNSIIEHIQSMTPEVFFKKYLQNPELDIKASYHYIYPLKYGNPSDEETYNKVEEYIGILNRIYVS